MHVRLILLAAVFAATACATPQETADPKPVTPEPQTNEMLAADCEGGAPGSCLLLGNRYEEGDMAGPDIDKAFDYYDKACALGSSHGCYAKALVLLHERDNAIRALPILEYTCDQANHGPSCRALGDLSRDGVIYPQDDAEALRRYGQSCETNYHVGCNAYIRQVFTASKQLVGLEEFANFLEKNCAAGHEMSCTEGAKLYRDGADWAGESIEPDETKAQEFAKMMASARRTRVDVDPSAKPPPGDLKLEDVSPQPDPEPFQPGYIVVSGMDGARVFVDGVDTGKDSPTTVTIVRGGRHYVQLQSKEGELTEPRLTWIGSGGRVELAWE